MTKEKLKYTECEQEVETIKKLSLDIYSTHSDKVENLQTLLAAFQNSVKAQKKIDSIFDKITAIKPTIEASESKDELIQTSNTFHITKSKNMWKQSSNITQFSNTHHDGKLFPKNFQKTRIIFICQL